MTPDYERLGVFYLGRTVPGRPASPQPLLYASRDLVTHAVCVGMTGSGKTGLAVALLEEAAIDGIPAIVLDPKGDLANLLLAFPALQPADFAPWVDPDEAARKGLSTDALAVATAAAWQKGLADWDQDAARVARFRDAVDVCVYTPGSSAGVPLALLRSLRAPVGADAETLREGVSGAVSALLGLLGVDADPLTSRDHILLSRIVHDAWAAGTDLDLGGLILQIQKPGFSRVGVFDLESFYPSKERMGLAMALNNLLASPAGAAWMEGEPLDIGALLHTPAGKPRISVISIAHLSDAERMFVVATLLGETVTWMRRQTGTSSLRALLFMDEIHGYFPPTANPPSKPPMLTLLKQARAFGLGVVLATQNPVDLDYKGLANCGTWFVGRLQTERDKARLVDGLCSAAGGGLDRDELDKLLASLGSRVFLLHDVHAPGPVLFQTRWTLSYLRGPLTRDQLKRVTASRAAPVATPPRPPPRTTTPAAAAGALRPAVPAGFEEVFLRPNGGGPATWEPGVYGEVAVHYVDTKARVDVWVDVQLYAPAGPSGVDWDAVEELPPRGLGREPGATATWGEVPAAFGRKNAPTDLGKQAATWVYRSRPLRLQRCAAVGLVATPGEAEGAFRARVALASREARDAAVEALRAKTAPKLAALEEKQRRAEARFAKEQQQAAAATVNTAVSFGATLFGALFGRKTFSAATVNKATSAVRSAGRAVEEHGDIEAAKQEVQAAIEARRVLAAEVEAEVDRIGGQFLAEALVVDELVVVAKKADLKVERVALAWRAGA